MENWVLESPVQWRGPGFEKIWHQGRLEGLIFVYIIYIIRHNPMSTLFFHLTWKPPFQYLILVLRGNNSVVECNLAKVEVAGSNPVSRSMQNSGWLQNHPFFCGLRTTSAYIFKS